jgi:hypothetical protein
MSSSARRASIRPAAQQQQQQAAPKQPSQNNDAEDRLRQELQVRRQQEAIAREMKQKAEQARAALIAVQKELKGKDYTYDSSGKLVLLQKVDPEHLPAPPGPQFKVHTPAAAGDADAAGKQGSTARSLSSTSRSLTSSTGKGSSSSTGNGKLRDSKAPAIPPSDYKQTASQTQPPVLEALRPAAGVTLRAGAAAKPGPNRDLAGHPTRTQYQQQAKAQNQQATRAVTAAAAAAAAAAGSRAGARSVAGTVAGSASMRSSSSPGWGSNAGAAAASTSGRSSPAPGLGGQAAAAAAAGAAASSSGRASPAPAAAGDSRGGLSSAGTASMLSSTAGALSSAGQPLGAGSRAAAAAAVQQRPASPDVNLVLVSAADWGAVGSSGYSPPPEAPVAVHKPTDKQIKEECEWQQQLAVLYSAVHVVNHSAGIATLHCKLLLCLNGLAVAYALEAAVSFHRLFLTCMFCCCLCSWPHHFPAQDPLSSADTEATQEAASQHWQPKSWHSSTQCTLEWWSSGCGLYSTRVSPAWIFLCLVPIELGWF